MTEAATELREELRDGVLFLIKENAQTRYGISLGVWRGLSAAFERAERDAAVRAVVIDAGGRGFHQGAMLVTELKPELSELDKADFRDIVQRGQALGRQIAALPKPVIGLARAGALGGGLEMLLRCDFLYTLDGAEFSLPEVTLGFVAAWGGTQWGGRMMPLRRAQEFMLLGAKLSGREAVEQGIATRSFATEEALQHYLDAVLERLKFCAPASIAQTKKCLAAVWQGPLEYGERIEMEAETAAMAGGDFIKAYNARVARRTYNFRDDCPVDGPVPALPAR